MSQPAPSVQLWSVRDAFNSDLNGTLQRLSEIGFTRVEPFGSEDFSEGGFFDQLAAALKVNRLEAPTIHCQIFKKDLEPFFVAASKLGVKTIIEPLIDPELWKTKDSVIQIAQELNRIAAEAKKRGFQLGYHNHDFEFVSIIDGRPAYELLLEHLSDDVLLEVDIFWATVGGIDVLELLKRLGNRVIAIHVKDGNTKVSREEITKHQMPAGIGDVPVVAALATAPHAIPVVEFDEFGGDIFDAIATSLKFVENHRA